MFGSLVIVLPTPHEGGALVLRDNGKEWTFDSAAIIKDQTTPSIAFVAFYSDVEHEVMKVTSGHRVTITYNLYSGENSLSAASIPFSIDPTRNELRSALEAYLADDTFLPRGGYLGFGLRREYAFHNDRQKPVKLSQFESHLKGSDAILLEVCRELSLSASLNVYFITGYANYNELDVINTTIPVLSGNSPVEDEEFIELLCQYDGRLVKTRKEDHSRYSMSPELYIIWVTPRREFCSVRREVLAYGNEPSLSYAYGNLCLLVGIGPFGERGAVDKIRVPSYSKKAGKGATKPKK
ncbi:hypothetical protein QCA50_008902 [Cerrena zonata]|uniref:Prolyl 4-hydroxylase alpha subunit Fe(2+) 2OG dioxygenase domain-containing protein n=1 Tax=Cerrena zonata TaxID=2478898 RepID=A0AAW0G494_9APHY